MNVESEFSWGAVTDIYLEDPAASERIQQKVSFVVS